MTRERPLHIVHLSHLMPMPPFVWRNDDWYVDSTGRHRSECYGAVYRVQREHEPDSPSSCFWIVPGTLAEGSINWLRAHLKRVLATQPPTDGEDSDAK
jgi:hypothetical protein